MHLYVMRYQNSPLHNPKIREYGCNVVSLLSIAERFSGRLLDPGQVELIYRDALRSRYIDADCTVYKPDHLTNLAFEELGATYRSLQIGARDANGNATFWGWVRDRSYNASIIKVRTERFNTHFMEGDSEERVVFDPWYPSVTIAKHLATYLIRIEELP